MRLIDLEPQFLRCEFRTETWKQCKLDHQHDENCGELVTGPRQYMPEVATLAEAQGVEFLCPKCFRLNGGKVGTHGVICWDPSVPQEAVPGGGRWPMTGTGFADLTLTPSVQLVGGCCWHGFVTNGEVSEI